MKKMLLTGKEVETYTDGVLSETMLRNWRCNGIHKRELPHVKVNGRVHYKKTVIDRFLEFCSSGKQEFPSET